MPTPTAKDATPAAGAGRLHRSARLVLLFLAALIVVSSALTYSPRPAQAQDDEIQGADLSQEQCDEAGGFWKGDYCDNYDEEQAREILERDEQETNEDNEDTANDDEIQGSDLSGEECREADGFMANNDSCRNFDPEKAREQIEGRESGEDPSEPQSEQSGSDQQIGADDGESDDSGGPIAGIMTDGLIGVRDTFMGFIERWAEAKAENLADQLIDGRYMIHPPSDELTDFYADTAGWVKPGAIALLLALALSMILRTADYNTAYAAQYGIPKIIAVVAGIAFMPDLIALAADLSQSMAAQLVDEEAVANGYEQLLLGTGGRLSVGIPFGGPGLTLVAVLIKAILGLLILFAVAVQTLVFGILYVLGPLAIFFYAIPAMAEIAVAWMKGMVACFAISILWAVIFGFGFRFVGNPWMLTGGQQSFGEFLPLLMSIGVLYLAWKMPWKVFSLAFASYSPSGGRSGLTALTALLRLGRGGGGSR